MYPLHSRSRLVTALSALTLAAAVTLSVAVAPARAEYPLDLEQLWGLEVIDAVALDVGVSQEHMRRVAWCESRYRPSAVGDYGRSSGLFQLNNLPTGLLHHFHYVGYTDVFNPWQSADYYARVLRGDFDYMDAVYGRVTVARWSCK